MSPARPFRYWTDAIIFWKTCGPCGRTTRCGALPSRQTPTLTPRTTRCAGVFLQSFADAHLPLTELVPCDARNQEEIGTLLPRSGFVMLCGGHVPTQNHFFAQLGLPGLFHNYHGIVLGVSAGSMNAARLVYAAPEEPGEAADPGYCRWLNGLGLTETRILPHYQFIREHILDGQRMEDIALADSRKRHFLALPDGSYLMCSDGHEALYGKAWYFADGTLEEINEDEDVLPLR